MEISPTCSYHCLKLLLLSVYFENKKAIPSFVVTQIPLVYIIENLWLPVSLPLTHQHVNNTYNTAFYMSILYTCLVDTTSNIHPIEEGTIQICIKFCFTICDNYINT